MKMTIAIPVMNELQDSKGMLSLLRHNTSDDTEIMIIDNGSTDKYENFVVRYLKPKRLNYIRNDSNIGLVKTMQQAYENTFSDILAVVHNDVYIYEKNWDQRLISYFKEIPKLGGIGLFGSQGCGPIGERLQDVPRQDIAAGMSNMLEAEIHGMRLNQPWRSAAIFDGFAMIFSMEMLKKGKGFDQRYLYHHLYDRDASLESLRRGYKNIIANVPCHHLSGLTANQAQYQTWIDKKVNKTNFTGDKWTHDENSRLFAEKFKDALPLYVNDDFSFRSGQQGQWNYQGDKILSI